VNAHPQPAAPATPPHKGSPGEAATLIGCGETGAVPPPATIGFKAHNLARMARLDRKSVV
jgi:hypothetical protein